MEQGNKSTEGNLGTRAILGNREHWKSRSWLWGTRENADFFQGNRYRYSFPPPPPHTHTRTHTLPFPRRTSSVGYFISLTNHSEMLFYTKKYLEKKRKWYKRNTNVLKNYPSRHQKLFFFVFLAYSNHNTTHVLRCFDSYSRVFLSDVDFRYITGYAEIRMRWHKIPRWRKCVRCDQIVKDILLIAGLLNVWFKY